MRTGIQLFSPPAGLRIFLQCMSFFLGAAVVWCLLGVFVASPLTVEEDGMATALAPEGLYLMLFRKTDGALHRGDLVVIDPPVISDESLWVRRVIAIPGQIVSWDWEGNVLVDGVILYESYAQEFVWEVLPDPVTVPEGCVYVLADQRGSVCDSSRPEVGCIASARILGTVWYRFPSEAGKERLGK